MSQNVYDDPEFFEAYRRLERSVHGLAGAAEWPSLRALLPDLQGRTVLDLGCGFGWFCRHARQAGAAQVLGVDVSERMLSRADAMTSDPAIRYLRSDLEGLGLPERAFDLAFSSLTLHYVSDLAGLLATVTRALVPGGHLVFSVEHPIFTAPTRPGWLAGADGRKTWPVDGYLEETARRTDWLTTGVVKHHRTIGTYLNLLIGLGFAIRHVQEWGPSPEQVAARPEWADERQRPMFLLVGSVRLLVDT